MKKFIGLELVNETSEILPDYRDIQHFINQHHLDYYQFGIIVNNSGEEQQLENLLKENNVFEAGFTLYLLENPDPKNTFIDFGFTSKEKKYYLYEELVIPFTTSGYNEKDIQAALEQMDEHLIATDTGLDKTLHFVERYHQELIEGIADAYKIIVTFYP